MEIPSSHPPKRKSKFRRALLFLALILLIITVIRETGFINLDYYQSDITSQTNVNWSGISIDLPILTPDTLSGFPLDSFELRSFRRSKDPCNKPGMGNHRKVVVHYHNVKKEGRGSCSEMRMDIDQFNVGVLWTPFVKHASFSATGSCYVIFRGFHTKEDSLVENNTTRTGLINAEGTATIKGICSSHTAHSVILDHVMNLFLKEGEKEAARH